MSWKSTALRSAAAVCGALTMAGVSAHHSDVAYYVADRGADGGHTRIEGTVAQVRLINPHSALLVEVENEAGESEPWVVETDSWGQLRRVGWEQDWVEVGDRVAVIVAMSRHHDTGGRIRDLLVYEPEPGVYARMFLEYIHDSEDPLIGQGSPPERVLQQEAQWQCPEYTQVLTSRPPGKESLLCFQFDDRAEFDALKSEYGEELPLLAE